MPPCIHKLSVEKHQGNKKEGPPERGRRGRPPTRTEWLAVLWLAVLWVVVLWAVVLWAVVLWAAVPDGRYPRSLAAARVSDDRSVESAATDHL